MSGRGDRAPSQRQLRVGEEIRHALAMVLERGELRDPGLQGVPVTITEVQASPDLRHAYVYVMPLGGEREGGELVAVLKALGRARPYLRRQISKALTLKFSPDLHFAADETFEEADRIGALLRDPHVAQDTRHAAKDDADPDSQED